MHLRHLSQVLAIEREAFPLPWGRTAFLAELVNPFSRPYVALEGEEVVGYMVLWIQGDTLHLANIAVRRDRRGQGIGTRLMDKAFEVARERRLRRITLEVRVSNRRAQRFYEKLGFRVTGRIKGYYKPNFEDALVYEREMEGGG